ncbi:MAG: hypothetical protein ACM336_04710 [Acidobacteriota bacterium]
MKKAAIAVALLVAAFLAARNWRIVAGRGEARQAARALDYGELALAVRLMNAAARHIPEDHALARDAASLTEAMRLMREERAAEALPLLLPFRARSIVLQAEMAAAFERKDYEAFVEKARAAAAVRPGTADAFLMLASADSCQYALTGEPQLKERALRSLAEAGRKAAGPLGEIEQQIKHRLETREILSPAEFRARYPRGWRGLTPPSS